MRTWLQLLCAGILLISIALAFGLHPSRHRFQQTLTIGEGMSPPVMIISQAEWVLIALFGGIFLVGLGLVIAGITRHFRDRA